MCETRDSEKGLLGLSDPWVLGCSGGFWVCAVPCAGRRGTRTVRISVADRQNHVEKGAVMLHPLARTVQMLMV